jgi:hypothetical protein
VAPARLAAGEAAATRHALALCSVSWEARRAVASEAIAVELRFADRQFVPNASVVLRDPDDGRAVRRATAARRARAELRAARYSAVPLHVMG